MGFHGISRKECTVELQFEFGDHALQPLSGIAEAMNAAGVDGQCESGAIDPWQHDEDYERAFSST